MAQDVIGRAERVSFPTLHLSKVPAKIDTGADVSSIWCSQILLKEGQLYCVFFAPGSPYYTGEVYHFQSKEFMVTRIANSFGHKELRYKVKIPMTVKGRTINATFTLADRSQKLYPVLIGRATLSGKFLVDVRKGSPLADEEKKRVKRLAKELSKIK
ncbi:MAG: hypothetical protein JWO96_22 [Candidatus Saccharibacteria bacterium]|nr:hypothetical protein [Candidatus Saccharibacteria bacterium]